MSLRSRGEPIQLIFDLTRGKPLKWGSGVPRTPGVVREGSPARDRCDGSPVVQQRRGDRRRSPAPPRQTVRVVTGPRGAESAINGLGTGAATAESTDR